MTINGDYVKILKRGVPGAFTAALPRRPYIVGIDAQQKLMCPAGIDSWRRFIDTMFVSVVDKAFGMGAEVVVVSFDDYRYTPSAKHETQRKRDQSLPDFRFAKQDSLPVKIPDNFNGAMRNRNFKTRVIFMVLNNLKIEFSKRFEKEAQNNGQQPNKTLVLKFLDVEVVGAPIEIPAAFVTAESKTGENDITLPAWVPPAERGPLLIISTDGDFVPISMMQIERTGGDIMLYRLVTNVGNLSPSRNSSPTKKPTDASKSTTAKHEFVSVAHLIPFVKREFPTQNPVADFATLVALTGCDFCMNLPRVGPSRVWQMRSQFRKLDLGKDTHLMLAMLLVYRDLYKKHVQLTHTRVLGMRDALVGDPDTDVAEAITSMYRALYRQIQSTTKLSLGTRQSVWVDARALAHCRNALWTREYWERLHDYPDPLEDEGVKYGFVRNERGWTQWRS